MDREEGKWTVGSKVGEKFAYLLPVPTMYVLVPCKVIIPGFCPRTRITRDDKRSTLGRAFSAAAAIVNDYEVGFRKSAP